MSPIRDPRHASMHDPAHAGIVTRILCGDLGLESEEAHTLLASCAQCSADLARLRAVTRVLDTAACEETETLAEARAAPPAATGPSFRAAPSGSAHAGAPESTPTARSRPATAGTSSTVSVAAGGSLPVASSALPASRTSATTPLDRRRWALPIALAAGLAFVFVIYSVITDAQKKEHVLGAYAIECTAPVGTVEQYTEFRARGAKPAHGWFRFEIYDESAAPGTPPVLAADHRPETVWVPKKEELATLPVRIRWRIVALDASGSEVDEDSATASRAH